MKKIINKFSPIQILTSGFLFLSLIGAFVLMLPISSETGEVQNFIDALFISTSAVSTTGLIVVDTGTYYSTFGEVVILILIQIGGLGYMILISQLFLGLGYNLSINSKKFLRQSISRPDSIDLVRFSKTIILMTIIIETLGAILLSVYWIRDFPADRAIYLGVFHSISAFCTAGFSLFYDSFIAYKNNIYMNIVINIICITGGIGFFVMYDIAIIIKKFIKGMNPRKLTLHSKLVLFITTFIILSGTLSILFFEKSNLTGINENLLISSFQIISSASTTGFNSIDIGTITNASLFLIILIMFVGASPGSTGGGIKTTVFGAMTLYVIDLLKGNNKVEVFKRIIPEDTIKKTIAITAISIFWVVNVTLLLSFTESSGFIQIAFETVSAFGTVGLSAGITSSLTVYGKILIILTMFLGRVGPLSLGFSLLQMKQQKDFTYAKEDIIIG